MGWRSAAGALLVLAGASPVAAHDAPQIRRILWRASDVLLQSNRGLIFGDPGKQRWQLLCNEAMHVNSGESPGVASLPDGTLLVATSSGLRSTRDRGCSFDVQFAGKLVPALAQDEIEPGRMFVATFPLGEASENVSGDSAIRLSEDGGLGWKVVREMADNDFVNALRIAASDGQRVYASGTVYGAGGREFYVARTRDGGAAWQRFVLELTVEDNGLQLLAVSPSDPELVLAKALSRDPLNAPDRLLISRDGGERFDEAARVMALRDAGFSADGKTLWLAGREGLFRSDDGGERFARVGAGDELTCAIEHDGDLHACGWYLGPADDARSNGIGRSTDRGESFQPWMTFQDVTEQVACLDGTPTHALCETPFQDWKYELTHMFSAESLNRDGGVPPEPAADAGNASDAGVRSDAGMSGRGRERVSRSNSGASAECARARARRKTAGILDVF